MINNQKRLLMTSPWLRYCKKAKEENFYLIAIWDDKDNKRNLPEISKYADELYIINMDDTDYLKELIRFIHKQKAIDVLYHLGKDRHVEQAYEIAEELGLALNSTKTISLLNNKLEMRKFLEDNGFSTVRYDYAQNTSGVYEKLKKIGFPCIVKPTNLTGSIGVFLFHQLEQFDEWERMIHEYDYNGPYLVEEYLEGPEVSVEAITFEGKHHIIGVTDKIKSPAPLFVEMGHTHPSLLPEHTKNQIVQHVGMFLDLIDYRFGPSHTEIIITQNGPKIVESHARLGGDQIPMLVELATGISMVDTTMKMLHFQMPELKAQSERMAKIEFFTLPQGKVIQISGVEDAKKLPFVRMLEVKVKPGDDIPVLQDSMSRSGFVIVDGDTIEEIEGGIKTVREKIKISVERNENETKEVLSYEL